MPLDNTGAPGTWIDTYSGIHFDLANPESDCVDLMDIAHALSQLCRYVGHCKQFYSVAEHSVRVAQILPEPLKMAGLLHDAAEAYTGDMSRPMKRVLPGIMAIEDKILGVIFKEFDVPQRLINDGFIRKADNVLIATELRDLMSDGAHAWGMEHIEPLADVIKPWEPMIAKYAFIHAFKEYQGRG